MPWLIGEAHQDEQDRLGESFMSFIDMSHIDILGRSVRDVKPPREEDWNVRLAFGL